VLEDDDETSTPWPFIGALAVFALIVIAVLIYTLTRGDGLTEEQRVGRSAVGQNDALQRLDYGDFRKFTCASEQATEPSVLAAQRDSAATNGARFVDDVKDVKIDGEKATGTVAYHFDKQPDNKRTSPLAFAKQDGQWKVCSAYR
jgi:hypothetical protein